MTLLIPSRYSASVIRLFLAILCSLGLVLSPAATSGAFAASNAMPGCTMDGHMPAKSADHSKMECCTPACQLSSAAALLPEPSTASLVQKRDGTLQVLAATKQLASFLASGLDPPPRLPS